MQMRYLSRVFLKSNKISLFKNSYSKTKKLIQRQRMQNAFSSLQPQKNQEQLINESSSAMSHSFKPYNSSNGIDIKSNTRTHNIISPKFKLGLRSSLIAKRKANINIIEEINTNNNNFQKLNSPLNSTKKKFNFRYLIYRI
jgi:hypothetical protein